MHNLSRCTHLEGVNYNQSFLFVQQRLGRGLAGTSSDQESGEETGKVSVLDDCKAKAEDVCIESIHDQSVDIAKDDNSTEASRKDSGTSDEGVEATSSCTHSHQSGTSASVLVGNSNRTDEQLTELESGKVVSAELITTAKTEALSLPRNQQGYDTIELQENSLSPPREGVVRYTSVGVQTEITPNSPATALPDQQVKSELVEEGDNFSLQTSGTLKCASIGLQTEPITPARLHTEPLPTIRPSTIRPSPMSTVFPPASGPLTASVATQCSCPVIPSLLSLQEKSTQTLTATHKDTGVQTVEDDIKSSNGARSITGYTGTAGEQPAAVSGEVSALQQELESMQNTVIWQALMLKLYTMQ